MTINTGVPTNLRRPQTFHVFTYQSGGRSLTPLPTRTLLIGTQKGGTGVAGTTYDVNDAAETDALFGIGSSLSLMCRKAIETCGYLRQGPRLFAIPVAENAAGAVRANTFTFAGTATAAGNHVARIAGRTIVTPIAVGDLAAAVAANFNIQVNAAKINLPVTSSILGAVVTAAVNHKGVFGGDVVFESISIPAGLTCVTVQSVAAAGVQDETAALAAAAGPDYDTIALENHTSVSVALALSHVTTAWGYSEKKWRWICYGEPGTIGTGAALATAANDKAILFASCEGMPSLPCEMAAALAVAITSRSRPNANWDGMKLPLYPPDASLAYTNTEIETALASGLVPLSSVVDANTRVQTPNVVRIEKMVTSQTTLSGQPFEVLRDLAVSRGGAFIARQIDAKFAERFGADANPDGVLNTPDTVDQVRDMVSAILYAAEDAKIVTGVEADLAKLVVEKDASAPGRINIDVTYTVVIGLHQVAFVHRVTI